MKGLDDVLSNVQINYREVIQEQTALPTYTVSLGPFSSLHDRACELWAILHGTRVDFGHHHALQYDHDRFGRDFSNQGPLFQSGGLGDTGADGKVNRAIMVAHSFGGNTVRAFERILHQGLVSEQAAIYEDGDLVVEPMSLFFKVAATPRDGFL